MSLKKADRLIKTGKFERAAKEIYAYLDNQKKESKNGTRTKKEKTPRGI